MYTIVVEKISEWLHTIDPATGRQRVWSAVADKMTENGRTGHLAGIIVIVDGEMKAMLIDHKLSTDGTGPRPRAIGAGQHVFAPCRLPEGRLRCPSADRALLPCVGKLTASSARRSPQSLGNRTVRCQAAYCTCNQCVAINQWEHVRPQPVWSYITFDREDTGRL
jgi:hypothetical protein